MTHNSSPAKIDLDSSQVEEIAKKAYALFSNGKVREARDLFKSLVKIDSTRFLPDLVKCYHVQADHFIASGREKDALSILEHVATITKNTQLKEENDRRLFSLAAKNPEKAGPFAEAVNMMASGTEGRTQKEIDFAVDTLVTAFENIPFLEQQAPVHHAELTSVVEAIRLVCAEDYLSVAQKLRIISIDSIFSQWKLLIKGMMAFYSCDDVKANEAFSRIRKGTVPYHASRWYCTLLDGNYTANSLPEGQHQSVLRRLCDISGFSNMADTIPRADYLWHVHRYRDSYRHVRDTLKNFPMNGANEIGLLTEFYFTAPFSLPEKECYKYISHFISNGQRGGHEDIREDCLVGHMFMLHAMEFSDDNTVFNSGTRYLSLYRDAYGPNPQIEARVMYRLGMLFSREMNNDGMFGMYGKSRSIVRNLDYAIRCLKKCIELDKEDCNAAFALLNLYRMTRQKREANSLLKELETRFPDNKAILLLAANNAAKLKSPQKYIKILEKLKTIDPLDMDIRTSLSCAFIDAARQSLSRSDSKQWREKLNLALENTIDKSKDFTLGRPYVLLRFAILCFLDNETTEGLQILEKAIAESEEPMVAMYFTMLIYKAYGGAGREFDNISNRVADAFKLPGNCSTAARLIEVFQYITKIQKITWLQQEAEKCSEYAMKSLANGFSRTYGRNIIIFALAKHMDKLARQTIKQALLFDKEDSLFLYFQWKLDFGDNSKPSFFGKSMTDEPVLQLKNIQTIAQKRHDQETLSLVVPILQDLEREKEKPIGPPPLPFDDDDSFNDIFNEDDFDGPAFEAYKDLMNEMMKRYNGDAIKALREIEKLMKNMDPDYPGGKRGKNPSDSLLPF